MASNWDRLASRWARFHERVQFGPAWGSGEVANRRFGFHPGRWMRVGGVAWVRLGSRSSWQAEDEAANEEANMIKPVEP